MIETIAASLARHAVQNLQAQSQQMTNAQAQAMQSRSYFEYRLGLKDKVSDARKELKLTTDVIEADRLQTFIDDNENRRTG